uniref:Macaca fascicularis brain cDNA clone: QflA-16784, similar to human hypothetical protein FLJ37543 (FLJ37543), mRNA, RefSeq: NM_173667.1 n=1 Tax=Macaca fascicularis TaxID=9541 RepID=I7GBH8_MACFA|nr:unnamed protein product [Macaca fascicularis]
MSIKYKICFLGHLPKGRKIKTKTCFSEIAFLSKGSI